MPLCACRHGVLAGSPSVAALGDGDQNRHRSYPSCNPVLNRSALGAAIFFVRRSQSQDMNEQGPVARATATMHDKCSLTFQT